jgi:hypothetical protein
MGATSDTAPSAARAIGRLYEPFHSVSYYPAEAQRWTELGYRGWWHAYFAYRSAPMGTVTAGLVTAVFYNFAPRMVGRAIPEAWAIRSPEATIELRAGLVRQALERIFAGSPLSAAITEAAPLARRAAEGCATSGRPLYGSYAELDWPEGPAMSLWHACTLLREQRGDSHNIALAAAGVDGVQSHILMAARGYGNRPTIQGIRGWTDEEWDDGVERLAARGLVQGDGSFTEAGRRLRREIEAHTDELADEPVRRLGDAGVDALVATMPPLVEHLVTTGEVAGRWPPPTVLRPD